MAGDWLKIETSLPEKREVMAITAAMGWTDPDLTVGKLFKLWRWFDQQTMKGDAESVTLALLDLIIGVTGFCQCVVEVGWMTKTDNGLQLPNFDRHNGKTAKTRALGAKRNSNYRNSDGKSVTKETQKVTPAPSPREEKRREDKRVHSESAGETLNFGEVEAFLRTVGAETGLKNGLQFPDIVLRDAQARLAEVSNDLPSVLKAIRRRVQDLKKNAPGSPHLLTLPHLFRAEKFHEFYSLRDLPVPEKNKTGATARTTAGDHDY